MNCYSGLIASDLPGPCCPTKTMNGDSFTLTSLEDTTDYGCLDQCVYHKDGEPGDNKYCFAHGEEEVECQGG